MQKSWGLPGEHGSTFAVILGNSGSQRQKYSRGRFGQRGSIGYLPPTSWLKPAPTSRSSGKGLLIGVGEAALGGTSFAGLSNSQSSQGDTPECHPPLVIDQEIDGITRIRSSNNEIGINNAP
jgi:hypothetical protein